MFPAPDALRLRFEDKLTIRAIAQRLGLSHSTIHTLFQRFLASGIAWPLPDSVSFAQLDAILYANRKKELTEPQIREGSWRKERRTSYSREFKVRLAKQALQPGAVVARIAREHDIRDFSAQYSHRNVYSIPTIFHYGMFRAFITGVILRPVRGAGCTCLWRNARAFYSHIVRNAPWKLKKSLIPVIPKVAQ
ncbi:transposase [Shigella flexneri]|nr:transposase [Shigella flexneri]